MDIGEIINELSSYATDHPLLAVAILVIVLFTARRRRGLFFTLIVITAIMAGVYLLIMDVADSGKKQKQETIRKSDEHPDSRDERPGESR